jgi:hypothetical protein
VAPGVSQEILTVKGFGYTPDTGLITGLETKSIFLTEELTSLDKSFTFPKGMFKESKTISGFINK